MDRTAFGKVLDAQGRRPTWVADRLGIHHASVGRWANGERTIPPARIPQLASLLGVEASEIAEEVKA